MFCLEFYDCLKEVIDIIEKNLDKFQQQKLLQRLGVNLEEENLVFSKKLENTPWKDIKLQLELLGRCDVVSMITKNTLITKGTILKIISIEIFIYRYIYSV